MGKCGAWGGGNGECGVGWWRKWDELDGKGCLAGAGRFFADMS